MVTPLVEIAVELANLYPEASPEEISEAIIGSIETEPMLREIFKATRLPSAGEIRLEELKAQRYRKRYRKKKIMQMKEKRELIFIFERFKSISSPITENSSSLPFTLYDGADITLEAPQLQPSNASFIIQRTKIMRPNIELPLLESIESRIMDDQYLKPIKEPMLSTIGEFIISPSKILEEINEKLETQQTLSFEDLQKINRVLEFAYDITTLNEIHRVLESDIKLRKEKFNVDCLKELYRDEDLLPSKMRTPRPKPDEIESLIHEKIRAIILHEYRRLHRLAGLEFIKGKITYDEYIKKTQRYAFDASKLFPR